jgi:transcriptional regulator with XRE-family HTH domain
MPPSAAAGRALPCPQDQPGDGLGLGRALRVAAGPVSFGALLRQLRLSVGLTQQELAAASGLSGRSISDLERGVHLATHPATARRLGLALNLTGPQQAEFMAAARGKADQGATGNAVWEFPQATLPLTSRAGAIGWG